jgi:hypothetical protein
MTDKATMTIKFRLSPSEYRTLRSRANRYYGGNLSRCIKAAISEHKIKRPRRSEAHAEEEKVKTSPQE